MSKITEVTGGVVPEREYIGIYQGRAVRSRSNLVHRSLAPTCRELTRDLSDAKYSINAE